MTGNSKKRLVVGNWKMYIERAQDAHAVALALKRRSKSFSKANVWIAPPVLFLADLSRALKNSRIRTGAQTTSRFEAGSHTGEISAKMLKDSGASFVIVGHSERRGERGAGESDKAIAQELLLCAQAGLTAILCIGERVRDEHGGHFDFLASELRSALLDYPKTSVSKLVIAYEPLWAIGKTARDAIAARDLRETVIFIRKSLADLFGRAAAAKILILYGGSVEGENTPELTEQGDTNGFLVGRASVDAEAFLKIIKACQ